MPPEFNQFIDLKCNRKQFIQDYLASQNVETAILSLEGKSHIYVKFPLEQYNQQFKIKTIIAHYDRAKNSPGANDNSSACFCIMQLAIFLRNSKLKHNMRIIFTDGEENEGSVKNQGAFLLASLYKKLKLTNDDIFVFDCTGFGEVPILNQFDFPSGTSFDFVKKYSLLEKKAEKLLIESNNGKWFKLKTAFSDNASFIANGIPCVLITMLPSSDVTNYLHNEPILTWEKLHTKDDNIQNISINSFEITQKILFNLAKKRFIVD